MMWDSLEKDDVVGCLKALALGALADDTIENGESEEDAENNLERCADADLSGKLDLNGSENGNEPISNEEIEISENKSEIGSVNISEDAFLIQSAVQRAAEQKHWNFVALLLLWGADIDHRDSRGRNLIHYLSSIPDSSISVLLSVLRKNPSLGGCGDSKGRTPLQYAEISENAPVATIIRVFQAQIEESISSSVTATATTKLTRPESIPSGQESPETSWEYENVNTAKIPSISMNNLTLAFSKVMEMTQRGPFKRRR